MTHRWFNYPFLPVVEGERSRIVERKAIDLAARVPSEFLTSRKSSRIRAAKREITRRLSNLPGTSETVSFFLYLSLPLPRPRVSPAKFPSCRPGNRASRNRADATRRDGNGRWQRRRWRDGGGESAPARCTHPARGTTLASANVRARASGG